MRRVIHCKVSTRFPNDPNLKTTRVIWSNCCKPSKEEKKPINARNIRWFKARVSFRMNHSPSSYQSFRFFFPEPRDPQPTLGRYESVLEMLFCYKCWRWSRPPACPHAGWLASWHRNPCLVIHPHQVDPWSWSGELHSATSWRTALTPHYTRPFLLYPHHGGGPERDVAGPMASAQPFRVRYHLGFKIPENTRRRLVRPLWSWPLREMWAFYVGSFITSKRRERSITNGRASPTHNPFLYW